MSEVFGYSNSELLKMRFKEVVHPQDHAQMEERYKNRIAGKSVTNHYEVQTVHKTGKIVPVEISGSLTKWEGQSAVIAILRDISRRLQIEKALRKSESNFKALAGNSNDGIRIAIGEEGSLVYVNRRFAEITGYSTSELLRKNIFDLADPHDLREVKQRYQKRLAGQEAPTR